MVRVFAALLLFIFAAAPVAAAPNVVLIVIDDLGQRDLGCYGSTFYETPNLDRLAAEGMRFTQFYSANPVCSPTRASLQTGHNPARLRLTNFLKGVREKEGSPALTAEYADQLETEEVTLGEMFSEAGYRTAFMGKWHLGKEAFYPERQGYEVNVGGTHSGHPKSYFWPQWGMNPPIEGEQAGEYLTDVLTDRACGWIEETTEGESPFFLCLCHYAVHTPIQPRADLLAKYEAKARGREFGEHDQHNPHYAAMVESMDESVGRVLDSLDAAGVADETVVIFTSDNGGLSTKEGPHTPATTNHPLRAGKGHLYEGGIRVPFLVRWPGVTKAGSACDVPAISDDVFPTLRTVAGVELDVKGLDGRDLSSLLRGQPDEAVASRPLFWHYPHFANQGGPPSGAVRRGDWKLIEFYEDGRLELYNLKDDPSEGADRSAEKPDFAAELRGMLSDWRKGVNANMPKANPAYRGEARAVLTP